MILQEKIIWSKNNSSGPRIIHLDGYYFFVNPYPSPITSCRGVVKMYSSIAPAESVLPKEAFSRTRSSCSVHLWGKAPACRGLWAHSCHVTELLAMQHTHSSSVTKHTQHTHRQTHMEPLGMGQSSSQQLWRVNQRLRMIEAVVVFLYFAYWWYWAKKFSNIWWVSCVFLIKPPPTRSFD